MGINSRVEGNTIVCPFHAWRFGGDGACVEIPGSTRIPARARVGCWTTREINGAIMVWHHDRNAPPDFELPAIPMADRSKWTAPLCRSVDVRTHVQEMNENIFDVAHFVHIHHYRPGPVPTIEIDGPFAHVTLAGRSDLGWKGLPAKTRNSLYGAGFTIIHVLEPIELGVIVLKTPIDGERVQHRYGIVAPRRFPGFGQLLVRAVSRQITRDVLADCAIWENKVYVEHPLLSTVDGPIMRFRKWHQQFY